MAVKRLGPFEGRYSPSYQLKFWRNGDPRLPVQHVDLRSALAIQTSKSLDDVSGTFTVTLKGRNARQYIQEMDVASIKLRGHDDEGFVPVMKGVVDTVRAGGAADTYASRKDTVIEGRCMGKYLQITSMFLPVWDPQALLPTALIFGLGDAAKKVGGNTPFDIWQYIVKRFMFGQRNLAGISGVPNSRFWVDTTSRFAKVNFTIPYLQYDEEDLGSAFKTLEIPGYTEGWIDEVGKIVYRQPPWDSPIAYHLPTSSLKDYDFPRTDVGTATYFEVIPAGDPGIDSATAQALRAGRAPVPSSYLKASAGQWHVDPEYVIDTDSKGSVTAKGQRNFWYLRQRRLGLRPQQVTNALIFTQQQAQAQAEGLLRFYGRMVKTMDVTIPGCPSVRLGKNVLVSGGIDADRLDRTFYIDGVAHEYVEGDHYDTTLHGSHGRDPQDPKFGRIVMPRFDVSQLVATGGVSGSGSGSGGGGTATGGDLLGTLEQGVSFQWKRYDQGQDIQTDPGAKILANGTGTAHLHNNGSGVGFGPNYCSVAYSDGPFAGSEVYYGHCPAVVHDGQKVHTGDVLAHTGTSDDVSHGRTGNASSPGWLEIGFWPPGSMSVGIGMAKKLGNPHPSPN